MQRLPATLLAVLTVAVVAMGLLVFSAQRDVDRRLQQLICLEKAHATADVASMVPESRADVDARISSAQVLGQQLDDC